MQNKQPIYYRNDLAQDDLKDIFDNQYICSKSTIIKNPSNNTLYIKTCTCIRNNPLKSIICSFILGIFTLKLYKKYKSIADFRLK